MTVQEDRDRDNNEFFRRQKLFEPLIESEAWKELQRILLAQHSNMLQKLLEPPNVTADGMAMSFNDHYLKGVVFGIQLTLKTPYATIETSKEIQRELTKTHQPKGEINERPIDKFDDDGSQLPDGARVTDLSGDH